MPVSVSRKIEFLVHDIADKPDIRLKPLMLTAEQCVEYNLPRTPIKDSDKRKAGFEFRHGTGATELDALEALHPGVMDNIIRDALRPYLDVRAYNTVIEENQRIREQVKMALQERLNTALSDLTVDVNTDFDVPVGNLVDEDNDWLFNTDLDYVDQLNRYDAHKRRGD